MDALEGKWKVKVDALEVKMESESGSFGSENAQK